MPQARITTKQWRLLERIRATSCDTPRAPPQPYPWGFHNTTWSSLDRRHFIVFTLRRSIWHVTITTKGHAALDLPRPSR